jgi:hypothetical protein
MNRHQIIALADVHVAASVIVMREIPLPPGLQGQSQGYAQVPQTSSIRFDLPQGHHRDDVAFVEDVSPKGHPLGFGHAALQPQLEVGARTVLRGLLELRRLE